MAETNNDAGDTTALEAKVAKQIEYYFGDMNLMRDKFLKEQIQEDDGWVSIQTMLKFNRLKQLSEDATFICKALKNSPAALMEVNEAGDKMRRDPSKPLPGDTKERREEIATRSIYAKAFPLDITLDELMTFFETYGSVDTVFLKRDFHKKSFKGSVFATFAKKEDAEKFVKEEGTKYKDQELERKLLKTDYFKEKTSKKKKEDKKEVKEVIKEPVQEDNKEEKAKQQMTKNAVLRIDGIALDTPREELKNFFSDFGSVGWADYNNGDEKAYIRLKEPNSAGPTLEKAKVAGDGKIIINFKEVQVKVVEGDEELEYWTKMFKDIAERQKQKKNHRGDRRQGGGRYQRGGRRNRGGPQGKRKSHGRDDEENHGEDDVREPVQKSSKVESSSDQTAD